MVDRARKRANLPQEILEQEFLEPSPYDSDGGNLIGKNPLFLHRVKLLQLEPPLSPLKAIRAWCIECSQGSESEARKCPAARCPNWIYRMGKNPLDPRFKRKEKAPDKAQQRQVEPTKPQTTIQRFQNETYSISIYITSLLFFMGQRPCLNTRQKNLDELTDFL